ncbi:MAG: VOC family protein [Chloroflexi bacterium]|nr:VOC family protein [Chloroflexota bacterium]
MTIRGLYSATLFVEDLDRAADFYVDVLGFEPETRSDRARMLRAGEFRLLLHVGGSTPDKQNLHLHLHLAVDDVDAFHREVSARGVKSEAPPETKPWGLRSFELRDPSGYVWEFVQEVEVTKTPG